VENIEEIACRPPRIPQACPPAIFFMNKNAQIILVSILAQSANAAVLGWNEGQILGLRTNNTVGFVFDGAPASSVDADGNGVIDDGQTGFYSSINVDSEGSASLDLEWRRFRLGDAIPNVRR
jgi:hypothetical protein